MPPGKPAVFMIAVVFPGPAYLVRQPTAGGPGPGSRCTP